MQELVSKDRRRWQYRIPRYYSSLADFAPEDSDQSLRVYPNPASDKIEVHYTSGSGDEGKVIPCL
ncbi:MAG: hypothetical protein IPM26_04205 [Saprospiraceae bacterium]|nr:hypothetical protein [Saprospiraceae bacterium]